MLDSLLNRIAGTLGFASSYLIRLDDACDTHDAGKWHAIERILDRFDIKPIVAVIPKNEDASLHLGERNESFWDEVQRWHGKGWSIALHGYTHRYHAVDRRKLVLPFYDRSEFAGLRLEDQCERLKAAYDVFAKHGIRPKVWVAPSHSFDSATLEALKHVTDISIVSDGIAFYPFAEADLTFIPQQLWWPKPKPFGVWTICLHPNSMCEAQIELLEEVLEKKDFWRDFITLDQAVSQIRSRGFGSALYARLFWLRWNFSHR